MVIQQSQNPASKEGNKKTNDSTPKKQTKKKKMKTLDNSDEGEFKFNDMWHAQSS